MFFTAWLFCGLTFVELKTEGQTIETKNLTAKLQNSDQNSR